MTESTGSPRAPSVVPGGSATLRPIVEWLADIGTTNHWVVSCYLKLEPRDRTRGKYLIKVKNRIKDRLAAFEASGASRADRDVVERDLERVRAYLEDSTNVSTGRGVAIFASESLDLFEAVPLPRVFRSRLVVDRSPLIRELAALDDEFGLVLCAVCDRTSARFFEVSAFGIEELASLTAGDATRPRRFRGTRGTTGDRRSAGQGGSAGEHGFHQRIREEKHRHYAATAEHLFELARGRAARGIVLAGPGADADAVTPHLHPYLTKQLLGVARVNPKAATPAEVMAAVLEVRAASERQWEAEAVTALADGIGTGWAVNGPDAVLEALVRGQVRTLVVDPTVEIGGFRCRASGRLHASAEGCRGDGEADPIPDLIDEVIEDALRQGAHVEVVEDAAAREQVDGIAALLRFRA